MKSFLLYDKKPTVKWSLIPDSVFFEGTIPKGYGLAICPHNPYIILDIDVHGNINGFSNIPTNIRDEYKKSLWYDTPSGGRHVWLKYTGSIELMNKTSGLGIDLRTHKGYAKWYLDKDLRSYVHLIKETSNDMNIWLESLFTKSIDNVSE